MKKFRTTGTRLLVLLCIFSLVFSLFGEAGAAASSGNAVSTGIATSGNFDEMEFTTLKKNEIVRSELLVNNGLSLTAASSDENVIRVVSLEPEEDDPGYYRVELLAVGAGFSYVSITASDGTSTGRFATVSDTPVSEDDYTLTSDTTQDFTIAQNGSYLLKMTYSDSITDDDPNFYNMNLQRSFILPSSGRLLLVSDNPAVKVTLVENGPGGCLFRIDADGAAGQTATLSTGSCNHPLKKLCTVKIGAAPKDIRLDTTGIYKCSQEDTYRFVAYTDSPTPPAASASNSLVSVKYQGKVAGGYEYLMTAGQDQSKNGYSLIRVTSGGEAVSFSALVDSAFEWDIKSDTTQTVSLAKGESYTFKFTIMGGGEPEFVQAYPTAPVGPEDPGLMKVQLVKKDGPDYYVKATVTSDRVGQAATVAILFPHSQSYNPNGFSTSTPIKIKAGSAAMKSDTTANFTLPEGSGYTFKITGASKFVPGTGGIFSTELVGSSGSDSFYRIKATGRPGQQAGFYMSDGETTKQVCVVTVGAPAMLSDTTHDLYVIQGQSYTFKITGASFVPGTAGVFKTELVKRSGLDSFYRITPTGEPGSSTGFYMSAPGQPAQKVCVASVAPLGTFTSDTNADFTIPWDKNYTVRITAPGAKSVSLTAGTKDTFWVWSYKRSGDDFYFTIAPSGTSFQKRTSGVYVSVDGRPAKKICAVTIEPWDSIPV